MSNKHSKIPTILNSKNKLDLEYINTYSLHKPSIMSPTVKVQDIIKRGDLSARDSTNRSNSISN